MTEPTKILIVEDDLSIIRVLEIILQSAGYAVYSTTQGEKVSYLKSEIVPDLYILDIGLPDANGIDIIQMIRKETESPIIMLSGKNTDVEKITSFQLGADDYVVKPFSAAELLARVQAVLRRFRNGAKSAAEQGAGETEFDPIRIDSDQHRVFISSKEVALTNKEFKLLELLYSSKGRVLSRDIVLDNVWGIDNCEIETRAVDACASRLRKKIRAVTGKDVIEGIPGSGYRLMEM